MDLRDLAVTPIFIILIYGVAYFIRPRLTDAVNKKYFFPALTVKIIGAIALGVVYQFYYSGGDTYNYHTHGSRVIWETLIENPDDAIRLWFNDKSPDLIQYTNRLYMYYDSSSFVVIKLAAFFDLFTLSTYSATAVCFALISFLGMWYFFKAFYELFPHLHRWIAFAAFFIPSVFFWGSGILKDTVIMACLGISTYLIKRLFIDKRLAPSALLILILSLLLAFSIKKYVLMCFVPAALFWVYSGNLFKVKSWVARAVLFPLILLITLISGFYAIQKIGESDPRYALERIAETARITAYDIRYWTGRDAGSGYSLGELDGSFSSMIRLAPQAVNVSLFRPYLWEVKNPLMLLSALESFVLLLITITLFLFKPLNFIRAFSNPNVLFCFIFSTTFSFAVGVSTYNFGTLVRYKIPMLPFYIIGLALIWNQLKSERKLASLDFTE